MSIRLAVAPLLLGIISLLGPAAGASVASAPAGSTLCPPATAQEVGCPPAAGSTVDTAGPGADDVPAVTAHRKPRVPTSPPPPVVDQPDTEGPPPEASSPPPAAPPGPEAPALPPPSEAPPLPPPPAAAPEVRPETTPPPTRRADQVLPQPSHRLPTTGGADRAATFAALAGALLSLGGVCVAAGALHGRDR